MATQVDFIVRQGLQVATNVVIGSYTMTNAAPINGMIVSGNVGIGTATPLNPLEVVGNIKLSTSSSVPIAGIRFADGTYQMTSASSYSTSPGGSNESIQFNVNNSSFGGVSNVVIHSSNSRVGIGTTQSNYPLQVNSTYLPAVFSTLVGSDY